MTKLLYAIVALVALATGALLFAKLSQNELPEYGLYYQEPRDINEFRLTDHQNNTFTAQHLKGKWSWIFFGYTSCPDVCPTTLQELNYVYDDFKAVSRDTQVLLISIDPQRDTVDALANYIQYFNKEFIALTAGHEVLFPLARNLGLMYAINDQLDGKPYTVDHSASMILINPKGQIAAIFQPNQVLGKLPTIEGDKLVSDFKKIVNLFK
ncbi:MAG: protein SCO1/2 [Alteromonadaceae bacterium]|jgi:protein SCO1/2